MRCIARRIESRYLRMEGRSNVAADVVRDGFCGDVACVRA
jgi:hypothetical protein